MTIPDAYDEFGNPMFLKTCLTITPAEKIEEARLIAAWHLTNVEKVLDGTPDKMLTISIGKNNTVTHYGCFRFMYPHEISAEVDTLNKYYLDGNEWISPVLTDLISPDAPVKFCCIQCSLDDFLTEYQLEIING